MSLATVISHFGYLALFVGLLLEGETVLVLAAFLARRGYLSLPMVILLGWMATFTYDQFLAWLGRTRGSRFLENRPAWRSRVERAKSLLGRNTNLLFLGVRFIYGLRTVVAFVIGMSGLDPKRFALLNFIGAFLWAMIFGIAGYLFGQLMEIFFVDIKKYEPWIVLGILIIGTFWFLRRFLSLAKKDRS